MTGLVGFSPWKRKTRWGISTHWLPVDQGQGDDIGIQNIRNIRWWEMHNANVRWYAIVHVLVISGVRESGAGLSGMSVARNNHTTKEKRRDFNYTVHNTMCQREPLLLPFDNDTQNIFSRAAKTQAQEQSHLPKCQEPTHRPSERPSN